MDEILVIGGAGFLGGHVVRMLRENGFSVRIFSRSGGRGKPSDPGIRYIAGDIGNSQEISAAVKGVKVVYDLAANPVGTWEEIRRAYVDGPRNVAEACLQHGVRRLVYVSSTAALDWGLNSTIDETAGVDEKARLRPGFYHLAKIAAEKLLAEFHAKSGLPVVVFRPAIVVGRGGTLCHSGIGTWRDSTCCAIVGKGRHPLAFVLVQDVAVAFLAAMDAPDIEGRTFNLAGDVRPSAIEMVHHMRERSRRNFRAYPQSLYKLHAVSWFKHLIKLMVGKESQRPHWHNLKCEQVRTQLDCSAAKKHLGWKPVSDQETFLREAIDAHLRPIHIQDLRLTG